MSDAKATARRLSELVDDNGHVAGVYEMALNTLATEGYIAILPRQPTLEIVASVVATTDAAKAYATAVIDEINRLTNRKFKLCESTIKQAKSLMRARIKLETMLAMVAFMFGKWGGKPDMVDYVQPSTLMRLTSAKKYIGMMEAGPARAASAADGFSPWGG